MLDLGENLRKLILAGVGVAAVTKEKGADVLNELVKKGELTIEQARCSTRNSSTILRTPSARM